jgi:small-conductance mechanosensitive channel
LRYEFIVGIAYENDQAAAIDVIREAVSKVEGVLKGDRQPSVVIDELAISTINIKVLFWVDTYQSTERALHNTIRSQVMDTVVSTLIDKGFSLPASVVEIKSYDPTGILHPKGDA